MNSAFILKLVLQILEIIASEAKPISFTKYRGLIWWSRNQNGVEYGSVANDVGG